MVPESNYDVTVVTNLGNRTWSADKTVIPKITSWGSATRRIIATDIEGDGDVDLLITPGDYNERIARWTSGRRPGAWRVRRRLHSPS